MKKLLSTIQDRAHILFEGEEEQGMELIQFIFVFAICVAVAAVVYSVLQGSFQPGMSYISHLADGAFTVNGSGQSDFNMYM